MTFFQRLIGPRLALRTGAQGATDQERDSLTQQISAGQAVSDDYFRRVTRELIREAEACTEFAAPVSATRAKTPKFAVNPFSGLTSYQSFVLEIVCLSRLSKTMARRGHCHFPRLTGLDWPELTLTMTDAGTSLISLSTPTTVRHLDRQVARIVETLSEADVVHLDLNPFDRSGSHALGKNVLISRDGTISLVDFDIAAVDGECLGPHLRCRRDAFFARGGYSALAGDLTRLVSGHRCITLAE